MDIVARWRAHVASQTEMVPAMWDREHEELLVATAAVLQQEGPERDALISAFRAARSEDDEFRWALAEVLIPNLSEASLDPTVVLEHPEVRPVAAKLSVRPALALSVLHRYDDEPIDVDDYQSWFAGSPAAVDLPEGGSPAPGVDLDPTRADGTALTHVLQLNLRAESHNQGQEFLARVGLPSDGILNVFHDLETFGSEPDDDPSAWRVTWRPVPDDEVPLLPTDRPSAEPAVPLNPQLMLTVESPLNHPELTDPEFERYERLLNLLEAAPYDSNPSFDPVGDLDDLDVDEGEPLSPWDEDFEPVEPLSRWGGFAAAERNEELSAVLHKRLPVEVGDEHLLLLDLNPQAVRRELGISQPSSGMGDWFHTRHLEVWARASDTAARNFANVWCFIRTDN